MKFKTLDKHKGKGNQSQDLLDRLCIFLLFKQRLLDPESLYNLIDV
jgi:hypothetical protein